MLFHLANSFPVVRLQVKVNGSQAVGEILGQELRNVAGIWFSMPRTPGDYQMTIEATDSGRCVTETTAIRTITVF